MKTFLLAGASIFAASVSAYSAYAQPGPPPPMIVVPSPSSTPPPNGCVWAGLAYSNGAQLCMAPKLVLKCNLGSVVVGANFCITGPVCKFPTT